MNKLVRGMVAAGVLIGIAVLCLAARCTLLCRQSEDELRGSLLASTPLGSSKESVQAFVYSKGWTNSAGKIDDDLFWRSKVDRTLGDRAIFATLGRYPGFPEMVVVYAVWIFDQKGKLADIQVRKAAVDHLVNGRLPAPALASERQPVDTGCGVRGHRG
jgi:hypothetical protein